MTLTRLAPARSTIAPPKSELAAVGSMAHRATTPAFPALPVVSSTSQGMPTCVMPSPATDSKVAPSRTLNEQEAGAFNRNAGKDRRQASTDDGTAPRLLAPDLAGGTRLRRLPDVIVVPAGAQFGADNLADGPATARATTSVGFRGVLADGSWITPPWTHLTALEAPS